MLARLHRNSIPIEDVIEARNGVQTSLNDVYLIKNPKVSKGVVEFTKDGTTWRVEVDVTRPYLDDSTGVRSHFEVQADARIIYPYRPTSAAQNLPGFEVIPEADMRKHYPLAFKYLTAYRPQIDGRKSVPPRERAKAFYVYGRVQAIGYCTQAPKIFYSTSQRGEKYGLDTTGIVYQSGAQRAKSRSTPEIPATRWTSCSPCSISAPSSSFCASVAAPSEVAMSPEARPS